jgi:ECF sigma factor
MRNILVDHARGHRAPKRGGDRLRLSLEDGIICVDDNGTDLLSFDEALNRLAAIDPQHCCVVELRVFRGLTVEESAEALGILPRRSKENGAWPRRGYISKLEISNKLIHRNSQLLNYYLPLVTFHINYDTRAVATAKTDFPIRT